jgi:hypothetical protein
MLWKCTKDVCEPPEASADCAPGSNARAEEDLSHPGFCLFVCFSGFCYLFVFCLLRYGLTLWSRLVSSNPQ